MKRLMSFLAACLILPSGMALATPKTVYTAPEGKRYHYRKRCARKNATKRTLAEAKKLGLTPCKKCVLRCVHRHAKNNRCKKRVN